MNENEVLQEVEAYCEPENLNGSLANVSALLMQRFHDINWVGFYLLDSEKKTLRLGPFQGKPACTQIPIGRGVCGLAALKQETLVVDNVDDFADHIVCDSVSQSEVVVPILQNGELKGVLDVDSASLARFKEDDAHFFERTRDILIQSLKF